jgi:hypothetical protein
MRVVIDAHCFADAANTLPLITLLYHGATGRHRVMVDDEQAPDLVRWLDSQSQQVRDECALAFAAAALMEVEEPARYEARVIPRGAPNWQTQSVLLPLAIAVTFLSQQFRIYLEDRVTDRAFLLCACTPQQRQFLEQAERAGHLTFDHGGGLGSMKRLVDGLPVDARFHYWLVFDSDALQPATPSNQAASLVNSCIAASIPYHMLSRRFIESYIPRRVLHGWVYGSRRRRRFALDCYNAFVGLADAQRWHYNMKHGMSGDADRVTAGDTNGGLYDGLQPAIANSLNDGFGRDIGDLFNPPGTQVTDTELLRDGSWVELNHAVETVIALIR